MNPIDAVTDRLIEAYDNALTVPTITSSDAEFDDAAAYAVLAEIERRRNAAGWKPVGRKIGFTNRVIWELYGVDAPMWARVWDRTVHFAVGDRATLSLDAFVQPRIELEVVFKLRAPIPDTDDAAAILSCVEWFAPGFEIVQCHFADWRFALADCTAAFGLHAALVIGTPVPISEFDCETLANTLATFEATLSRGEAVVDLGIGANVLDSPALALAHLARVVAGQSAFDDPAAGEVITTGTITNAHPVAASETWTSDYGDLGLHGLEITFT